ncbi:rootletin-like [Passer domesticus]|uniref:rootletin-like n=1 Tax=Passer domesticus TaxID=48849 RepID=UPI0030FE3D8F
MQQNKRLREWKELAAFERKRHSSLERASEVAAQTAEEWQPQRDLLKEAVPLAVPKVCRRQRPAHRGLEKVLQEFSRQGHTLSQVCREKAVLAQENAALEARLAATERDLRGLSEQLAEARSEKESLQSSLLEAQQRISELEMARSRVEAQVRTATQAKEAILEDVRGLRRELLAVRALSQQQCEDMAEQLRWAEEQCGKALRLWQSAQEEEKRKLVQELQRQVDQQHVKAREQLEERANFLAQLLQEEQRQKAALLARVCQLQRELSQKEQLRQELTEERENGQMDAGSPIKGAAAAASCQEASCLQPGNRSMSSSRGSSQEREKQLLKLLSTSRGFLVQSSIKTRPGIVSPAAEGCHLASDPVEGVCASLAKVMRTLGS